MKSRIRTHKKRTREQTQEFSTAPAQPMFQSRPFVVQTQTAEKSQPGDLKTALTRAERYGHHVMRRETLGETKAKSGQMLPKKPPVQRKGEAKKSIEKPTENKSEAVPDLPADLVQQLETAKNKKANRESALKQLYEYLKGKGAIEDYEKEKDQPEITTKIVLAKGGGDKLAVTQYKSTNKKPEITITVYEELFQKSVQAIYSTFRHELIHAAQRTAQPDELASGAQESDDYMYENAESEGDEKVVGKATFDKIQHPLQEIETHVWEIENAEDTGIAQDEEYYRETVTFLGQYVDALVKNLVQEKQKTVVNYWKGYIEKAIKLLSKIEKKVEQATEWKEQLKQALEKALGTEGEKKGESSGGAEARKRGRNNESSDSEREKREKQKKKGKKVLKEG